MGYDRNDPWMTCGEHEDRTVSEEQLARCLWEAEYDGVSYPWEKQTSAEQLTYRQQAQKVLRDFIVLHS